MDNLKREKIEFDCSLNTEDPPINFQDVTTLEDTQKRKTMSNINKESNEWNPYECHLKK